MILDLIAMFIIGAAFMACIETMIVMKIFFDHEDKMDDDLDQMCLWYEDEYKEDDNAE